MRTGCSRNHRELVDTKAAGSLGPAAFCFRGKEAAMEAIISDLVSRFEKGSLSRRDLVSGLALLAAGGTAAAAQTEIDFKTADIDHVSMQAADLQRSVEFYQKTFG